MKLRALSLCTSVALPLFAASIAHAEPTSSDKAMATQLYDDADKQMSKGDFASACPKYGESQRLDPQLGTLLHLADCYERAGMTASAWASFKEAIEVASRKNAAGQNEPREKTARARAAALETKLSRLAVTVASPDTLGLEVQQDGQGIGRALWGSAFPVDPGTHVIAAKAPGRKGWTKTVQVATNGAKVDIAVPALDPETAPSASAAPASAATSGPIDSSPKPAADDGATSGGSQRAIGFAVGGVGVVGLVVGTVFVLKRSSALSEREGLCPNDVCADQAEANHLSDLTDRARSSATMSAVGFIAGGVALVTGGVLVLTAPSSSEPTKTATLRLEPWAGTSSLGAVVAGRW